MGLKGNKLNIAGGFYIPEVKGVIVYCYQQKQKHKKCKKCSIHLFHSRAGFPLYCFPIDRIPDEVKNFEKKCMQKDNVSKEMALHYKPEEEKK